MGRTALTNRHPNQTYQFIDTKPENLVRHWLDDVNCSSVATMPTPFPLSILCTPALIDTGSFNEILCFVIVAIPACLVGVTVGTAPFLEAGAVEAATGSPSGDSVAVEGMGKPTLPFVGVVAVTAVGMGGTTDFGVS